MRRVYIGATIGFLISFFLPVEQVESILRPIVHLVISIGRYFLLPTLFFGIIAGFSHRILNNSQKRESEPNDKARAKNSKLIGIISTHQINKNLYLQVLLILFCATVVLVILGGGSILLLPLPRLSIIFQEFEPIIPLGIGDFFTLTFPQNLFSIFAQDGNFVLPVTVLAFLVGLAMRQRMSHNSLLPKITIELSDVFYSMLSTYISLLGIGMILISAYITMQIRSISNIELYYQFILIISLLTAGIILILYPIIAIIIKSRTRPLRLTRSIISSTIVSVLSGDSYFSSIMVLRLFRSRFPVNKDIPYTLTIMGMLFSKAGSAFVASVVFFAVLKSYTAIEITFLNTIWVMGMIVLFSPLASTSPKLGVLHLLVTVAMIYGNGLENSFLIIMPLLPILISIATLLDTLTITFFGYLIADKVDFSASSVGGSKRIKRS